MYRYSLNRICNVNRLFLLTVHLVYNHIRAKYIICDVTLEPR